MRSRYRLVAKAASLVLAGGFLLGGIGTTCTSFAGEAAIGAVDFCFIFDCQNALGGTVNPCVPFDLRQGEIAQQDQTLLMDCP